MNYQRDASGIGIENTRNRLKLFFDKEFKMEISSTPTIFIVNLDWVTIVELNHIIFDQDISIPVITGYRKEFQSFLDGSFLK